MKLEELFRRLSYGRLANLSGGGEGVGAITEPMKPRVVNYANEALLLLHSKFLLRENVLMFKQVEHLTYYYMMKRYAFSELDNADACEVPHHYIIDTVAEPYEEDLIKVLTIMDSDGCTIPINDPEDYYSVYTPQPNLIQVPLPVQDRVFAVGYQARHPILEYTENCQEIDLPFVLEAALISHIAYQVFSDMTGQENAVKAREHLDRFEAVCQTVIDQDLVSQGTASTLVKFEQRGFA